jgi:hypothetical protein
MEWFLTFKTDTYLSCIEVCVGTNVRNLWVHASKLLILPWCVLTSQVGRHEGIPNKICPDHFASSSVTRIQVLTSHEVSYMIRPSQGMSYIRPLARNSKVPINEWTWGRQDPPPLLLFPKFLSTVLYIYTITRHIDTHPLAAG